MKTGGSGSGSSWADAADDIGDANAWINSQLATNVYYILLGNGGSYGAPLSIGAGTPAGSGVIVIGGLDPNAPANLQGLYQERGSTLDGGADCSDGVPAGVGQVVQLP